MDRGTGRDRALKATQESTAAAALRDAAAWHRLPRPDPGRGYREAQRAERLPEAAELSAQAGASGAPGSPPAPAVPAFGCDVNGF